MQFVIQPPKTLEYTIRYQVTTYIVYCNWLELTSDVTRALQIFFRPHKRLFARPI